MATQALGANVFTPPLCLPDFSLNLPLQLLLAGRNTADGREELCVRKLGPHMEAIESAFSFTAAVATVERQEILVAEIHLDFVKVRLEINGFAETEVVRLGAGFFRKAPCFLLQSRSGTGRFQMTIASNLLQQHIQTLVEDNAQWQTLIADDILWELAYASSLGHPAQLAGRKEAVRHATWFVGAVENIRFFDLKIYAVEVKGEGLIKSTGRMYRQDYVVFLRAADGKIAFLREYFDPVRAAKALDTPILGLES